MFDKLQQAFWKALTPDLVPDEIKVAANPIEGLSAAMISALGGVDNLKSQQPVALTRVRVALHDAARVDRQALSVAGVAGVMPLGDGVLHLITGLCTQG
ncbi:MULTISPECIES: PTS transporter subunit EIIB [Pseudomonas fluorescens group]|uniref:PTS transporter subunit EIIB n=1 Tax=Pseudomonas fluorescens group TaxID=136843 RepID=UPI00087D3D1B|nr:MULTISPECIES: PTS transporter subunit EIIB [Pseudomonas fluorescens group]SDU58882.1 Phosphotransferase system IIB components [Pseudomonas moraviensis]